MTNAEPTAGVVKPIQANPDRPGLPILIWENVCPPLVVRSNAPATPGSRIAVESSAGATLAELLRGSLLIEVQVRPPSDDRMAVACIPVGHTAQTTALELASSLPPRSLKQGLARESKWFP